MLRPLDERTGVRQPVPHGAERLQGRGGREALGLGQRRIGGRQPCQFVVAQPGRLSQGVARGGLGPSRGAQQGACGGGRQPADLRGEQRLDQLVAPIGEGSPLEREQVGDRARFGAQGRRAAGSMPRDVAVVERAEQSRHVRVLPADDDREVAPIDRMLHMDATKLARDRRVLL